MGQNIGDAFCIKRKKMKRVRNIRSAPGYRDTTPKPFLSCHGCVLRIERILITHVVCFHIGITPKYNVFVFRIKRLPGSLNA